MMVRMVDVEQPTLDPGVLCTSTVDLKIGGLKTLVMMAIVYDGCC